MKISILTEKNDDFKIFEGKEEIVDFKYLTEGQILEEAGAVFQNNKFSIFPQTSFLWMLSFIPKKAKILKDKTTRGEIVFGSWDGTIIRHNGYGGVDKKYRLIPKRFSRRKYILLDNQKNELFELLADFKMLELKTDYQVSFKSNYLPKFILIELLMYSIYAISFLSSRTVGE